MIDTLRFTRRNIEIANYCYQRIIICNNIGAAFLRHLYNPRILRLYAYELGEPLELSELTFGNSGKLRPVQRPRTLPDSSGHVTMEPFLCSRGDRRWSQYLAHLPSNLLTGGRRPDEPVDGVRPAWQAGACRQGDHSGCRDSFLDHARKFKPAKIARQVDIGDQQVEDVARTQDGQRLEGIGRFNDVIALEP